MSTIRLKIKRERNIGRQRGSLRWPLHIVMLICEPLVNVTTTYAIPDNIQKTSNTLTGSEADEITSLDYVRKCRVFMQSLNGMLAAYILGKADNWHHIFTNGTTRRQITFQNLVICFMTDVDFESVISSSCIFLENETLESQVEAVKNKVRC